DPADLAHRDGLAVRRRPSDRRCLARPDGDARRVQAEEWLRVAEPGDGHVDDLALGERGRSDGKLRRVRIALQRPRRAPDRRSRQQAGRSLCPHEVRDPALGAGEPSGSALPHGSPHALADGLLAGVRAANGMAHVRIAGRIVAGSLEAMTERRTIDLLREGFPHPAGMDTAVSRAILTKVSDGELPESLRLHRPSAIVAFGPKDRLAPGFAHAVGAAAAQGFASVHRLAGGRAAVFHDQTIAFSWAVPSENPRTGIT